MILQNRIGACALFTLLLVISTSVFGVPVNAQDSTPTSGIEFNGLEPITTANAGRLVELAHFEQDVFQQVIWSPDGNTLALMSDWRLWLYDLNNMNAEPRVLESDEQRFICAVFTPENKLVTFGLHMTVWDVTTGELVHSIDLHLYQTFDTPLGWAFNQDGSLLAVWGNEDYRGIFQVWDTSNGSLIHTYEDTTTQFIHDVAFSLDATVIALGGGMWSSMVDIWDVATWTRLHSLSGPPEPIHDDPYGAIWDIAFSPDGTTLTAVGEFRGAKVCVWETTTWQRTSCMGRQPASVWDVFYSFNGRYIVFQIGESHTDAAGYRIRTAETQVWDVQTDTLLFTQEASGASRVSGFGPDSVLLVTTDLRTIYLWDTQTGDLIQTIDTAVQGYPTFSPDGKLLAFIECEHDCDVRSITLWGVREEIHDHD